MIVAGHRWAPKRLMLAFTGAALTLCSMTTATQALTPGISPVPEPTQLGSVELAVSGSGAGIQTEYFEQAVTDAIVASGLFSDREDGSEDSQSTPYVLDIRIIKIGTPTFATRMTVSMNAVWKLYRSAERTTLLQENVQSTYTGTAFEGGLIGANRVRAATEGAARENVRMGLEMLGSVDLDQD